MRFSKETQGFYPEDFDYPNLPSDLVRCSDEDFRAALIRPIGSKLDVVNGRVKVVINANK